MAEQQTLEAPIVLSPPELIAPVSESKATDMVPIKPETKVKIDAQVEGYVEQLLVENVHSDEFKAKLDAAFRLGREEISNTSILMTGHFMNRNFVGIEDSASFKSILEMRGLLDELNPGKQGDLLSKNKIFGLIPFGNKLEAYFRKFQKAGPQFQAVLTQIHAARDDMQRDTIEIEQVKAKFWDAMQKLKGAIYFAEKLDGKISERIEPLRASDPLRAKALEQEVLFYARQNLQDMLMQMAVSVNGYLSLDVLKKTAREMSNGCDRVATTGMAALATAQTVARATGNQIQVMEMLTGVSNTIGDLVVETSKQLGAHVEKTGDFASNPLIAVQKMQTMFDNTFAAMDSMDNFRSKAIETMGKNNEMIRAQLARSEQYMQRASGASAQAALKETSQIEGPVKL